MTIKASALLAIVIAWGVMIAAVAEAEGQYWTLVFVFLATAAIGGSFWRSFGIARLVAIAGIWAGTAVATVEGEGWTAVFAFLATATAAHSIMRPRAILNGIGIAAPWAVLAAVTHDAAGEGSWISIFAFLTAVTVANHRSESRGAAALLWWGAAGTVMVLTGGWYWLAVVAWLLSVVSLGFRGFWLPRRIEWDL